MVLLALAAIVLFTLALWGDTSHLLAADGDQVLLRLRYATFDPLLSPPTARTSGMVASPTRGVHPYIVQFRGPIRAEWRAAILAAGARIVDYVPDYAYVVLSDAAASDKLRVLPHVRWVGYLQPLYRIDPVLPGAQGVLTVTVAFFDDAGGAAASSVVNHSGGAVLPDSIPGQGAALRATLTTAALQALAAQPSVAWIEPYRRPRLWNDVARAISNVSPRLDVT